MQSITPHSTLSSQLLWTRVTSGALRPPVPTLTLVASPLFATLKFFSTSHSSTFPPSLSSGCLLSHSLDWAFKSPPTMVFSAYGSSRVSNSLLAMTLLWGGQYTLAHIVLLSDAKLILTSRISNSDLSTASVWVTTVKGISSLMNVMSPPHIPTPRSFLIVV